MIDNMKAGRAIAALRQRQGLTQQQLAAMINVSHQAVSKWENGAALPDIQTLEELSHLFGVTMEQLLNGEVEPENREAKAEEVRPMQQFGEFVNDMVDGIGNFFRGESKPKKPAEPENGETVDLQSLLQMAPFMSKGAVAEMLEKCSGLTAADIARFAPFLEGEALEKLIRENEAEVNWDTLRRLAPFLKKEAVDTFARAVAKGEKYIRPAAENMQKTFTDVSQKIGAGMDHAVRKAVKLGEEVASGVGQAFEDRASKNVSDEQCLEVLRRKAMERALKDENWNWIAAHIDEVTDENLRSEIAEQARCCGMDDWVCEHMEARISVDSVKKAISDGDWEWIEERFQRLDDEALSAALSDAVKQEKFDWLMAVQGIEDVSAPLKAIAEELIAEENYELAARLTSEIKNAEVLKALVEENAEAGDGIFLQEIALEMAPEKFRQLCIGLASDRRWEILKSAENFIPIETAKALMETAIEMGDLDAFDWAEAILMKK